METIKICRASGQPVNQAHLELFQNEYRSLYDRVLDKCVPKKKERLMDAKDADRIDRLLMRLERALYKKYPNVEHIPCPTTNADWEALVRQYGPVALAIDSEIDKLALVIMDAQFGG